MSNLEITATIKSMVDNSTLTTLPFTFNEELNCYVCEVDINDFNIANMSEARVDISMHSIDTGITKSYDRDTIYLFNVDHDYICDRTSEDVAYAKQLHDKWMSGNGLVESELAQWNAGLKGALNPSDITRIQNTTNTVLNWYIKKYNSFNSGEPYYISALSFYSSVIPDGMFFYKAGLTTMVSQLNKLFTWLYSQPYIDMQYTLHDILVNSAYYLTYGSENSITDAITEHTDIYAWNDVEILLYILFLTVISYNRHIAKQTARSFIYQEPDAYGTDFQYCGESLYAGSIFI